MFVFPRDENFQGLLSYQFSNIPYSSVNCRHVHSIPVLIYLITGGFYLQNTFIRLLYPPPPHLWVLQAE